MHMNKSSYLLKPALLFSISGILCGCNTNLGGDLGGGGVVTFVMVFAEILKTCWLIILLAGFVFFLLGLAFWIILRKK